MNHCRHLHGSEKSILRKRNRAVQREHSWCFHALFTLPTILSIRFSCTTEGFHFHPNQRAKSNIHFYFKLVSNKHRTSRHFILKQEKHTRRALHLYHESRFLNIFWDHLEYFLFPESVRKNHCCSHEPLIQDSSNLILQIKMVALR